MINEIKVYINLTIQNINGILLKIMFCFFKNIKCSSFLTELKYIRMKIFHRSFHLIDK